MKPPIEPSTVLLGLTYGQSLRLPRARPAKNAPVSDMNAPTRGAMARAGETQRSRARLAKPAGSAVALNMPAARVAKPSCFSLPCVIIAIMKA